MIRRADAVPEALPGAWDDAVHHAARITYRQALAYERAGWPRGTALLRRAFWLREDVPEGLRGIEAEGRPDPRAILGDDADALEAYKKAEAAWRAGAEEWSTTRLDWLIEATA